MLLSLGLILSVFGLPVVAAGIMRVAFGRPGSPRTGSTLIVFGMVSLLLGVVMVHLGRKGGDASVLFGLVGFITGLAVIAVGLWLAIWGPLGIRNLHGGLAAVAAGLALVGAVALILTSAGSDGISMATRMQWSIPDLDLRSIVGKPIGPITFGQLSLAVLLATNGLALRNRISPARTIGANLVVLSVLAYTYAIADELFR